MKDKKFHEGSHFASFPSLTFVPFVVKFSKLPLLDSPVTLVQKYIDFALALGP
jgi:hypothetical protein